MARSSCRFDDTSTSSTSATLNELAQAHGYDRAFWWTSGIAVGGAVIAGALLRGGLLADPASVPPVRAQPTEDLDATGTRRISLERTGPS